MNPLIGGLISGGASLIGGLLDKPKSNKAMNSSIRKSNREAVQKANQQEVEWNRQVQKKASAAAKVPIVTTTKYGSKETTTTDLKETTKYGRRDEFRSYVDVPAMMAAAQKSGFNPVTFLQAGGLQAFTRTSSVSSGEDVYTKRGTETYSKSGSDSVTETGAGWMQAALVGLDKPAFHYYEGATDATQYSGTTPGQAIGNALGAGVNTYLAQQQQLSQNEFQKGLVQMQLVAANQRGSSRGYSLGGVPSMRSTSASVNTGGGVGAVPGSRSVSTMTPFGRITNPAYMGSGAYDQFGEILGPFVQLGAEGPGMWGVPGNKKATVDAAKTWDRMAGDIIKDWGVQEWNKFKEGIDLIPGNTSWKDLKTAITGKSQ